MLILSLWHRLLAVGQSWTLDLKDEHRNPDPANVHHSNVLVNSAGADGALEELS